MAWSDTLVSPSRDSLAIFKSDMLSRMYASSQGEVAAALTRSLKTGSGETGENKVQRDKLIRTPCVPVQAMR